MKVQITVEDKVWKQAKAKAALEGVTLGELVGEALGRMVKTLASNIGDSVKPVDLKVGKVVLSAKEPSISQAIPPTVGVWKNCVKCKKSMTNWVQAKDGKYLCQDCASDLINAQP